VIDIIEYCTIIGSLSYPDFRGNIIHWWKGNLTSHGRSYFRYAVYKCSRNPPHHVLYKYKFSVVVGDLLID